MPDPVAAPAAAPSSNAGSSPAPVKPNPVGGSSPGKTNGSSPVVSIKPQPTAPPAQQTAPQKHKWTAKVNGQEQELEATDEDLRGAFLQRTAAERRFEESARLRKEAADERSRAEQTMARISDKKQWLKALRESNPDMDPTEFLANELKSLMEEEELLQDPNIRERRRLEQENEGFRAEKTKADQLRVKQEQEQQTKVETDRIAGKFKEALSLTKLPINDMTVRMMAEAEWTNRERGWDLSPEKLAQSVEKAMRSQVEAIVAHDDDSQFDPADLSSSADADKSVLGAFPKLTARIHRAIVREYKRKQAGGVQRPTDMAPRERQQDPTAEQGRPRVVSSAEEQKIYGLKGLRTI